TFGFGGGQAAEIKGAMYGAASPVIKNYIYGLGGRDMTPERLERMFMDILNVKDKGLDREIEWIDVKGVE
ncbi:MAG: pyruvate ferredoxin oxidoreductase, partial [Candidatus Thermoplasmatota archaeon]|nr:pyruvate ferredoxin oxidoreductase [Candidatus Thermoplasmatota archaeon]